MQTPSDIPPSNGIAPGTPAADETADYPPKAALELAALGWPTLQLCWAAAGACACGRGHQGHDIAKAPLTTHGHLDATTDLETIRRCWRDRPLANVGVALRTAGLVVVGPDCPEWADEFARRGLPPTAVAASGGGDGHLHYYYRRPAGCPAYRIARPGRYDILSDGYVVAPPSRHASGRVYTWLVPPESSANCLRRRRGW